MLGVILVDKDHPVFVDEEGTIFELTTDSLEIARDYIGRTVEVDIKTMLPDGVNKAFLKHSERDAHAILETMLKLMRNTPTVKEKLKMNTLSYNVSKICEKKE